MPSGNVIIQTDRDESPHLKTDGAIGRAALEAELIEEGPGLEAQVVHIRIRKNWNIGWIKVEYIKSDNQNSTVQITDSQGAVLASLPGTEVEGEFISAGIVNMGTLPDPHFMILEITGGSNTFLYYAVAFLPSPSGSIVDSGAAPAVNLTASPRTGDWRSIGILDRGR